MHDAPSDEQPEDARLEKMSSVGSRCVGRVQELDAVRNQRGLAEVQARAFVEALHEAAGGEGLPRPEVVGARPLGWVRCRCIVLRAGARRNQCLGELCTRSLWRKALSRELKAGARKALPQGFVTI